MKRHHEPRFDHAGLEFALRDDMPFGWRHPVTGRKYHLDDPALERLGVYLRRARYIAGRSQDSVAAAAGVAQGQISRLERALAPAMKVERLAWIEDALDGAFPLGYCPHDHICQWRRLKPRLSADEAWAAEVERQQDITRRFYRSEDSAEVAESEPESSADDEFTVG